MPERKFGTGTGLSMKVLPELGMFRSTCSEDCAHCPSNPKPGFDWTPAEIREIVQRREKPGIEKFSHLSGPKKCLTCGFMWIAKPEDWKSTNEYGQPGSRLQCPQCGSMNAVGADEAEKAQLREDLLKAKEYNDDLMTALKNSNNLLEKTMAGVDVSNAELTEAQTHLSKLLTKRFPDTPSGPREPDKTPEDAAKSYQSDPELPARADAEIERTQRLLAPKFEAVPLTVGDLSGHAAREKEARRAWARKSVNQQEGVSIGDLSRELDHRGLDELYTPPQVHFYPESGSQKILERKYEADAKARDTAFLVQNPSELQKRAEKVGPRVRKALADAERRKEELAQEEVLNQLRAKGIKI
jgi:hypothetical protein